MATAPLDSSTVVLLRETPGPLEVLLVERHARSDAFAGVHAFPGGVTDPQDRDPEVGRIVAGAGRVAGGEAAGEDLLAFAVGAIRELFEEVGLLLAYEASGGWVDLGDPARAERLQAARAELHAGRETLAAIVARERLVLATDVLLYYARWITPVVNPRRFDTRFFVAPAPPGQVACADGIETTRCRWLTPAAALGEYLRGDISLVPPTLKTIEELRQLGSAAAVLGAARGRQVRPLEPEIVVAGGETTIVYPGYDGAAAGGPGVIARLVLRDGRWVPEGGAS
jgi:8-oxo-dGTP pyrophosphatase MutT (NUDIX family)